MLVSKESMQWLQLDEAARWVREAAWRLRCADASELREAAQELAEKIEAAKMALEKQEERRG